MHSTAFIQYKPPPTTTLRDDLVAHLTAPESFLLVFGYLASVWMLRLMPASYYDRASGVNWFHVLTQFVVVDAFIYAMHRLEHAWPALYQRSHKPHHVWINPKLYNAFNGSVTDTVSLILIPLFATHHVCRFVNNWSFIAFGTLYAAQFTLIHCEFAHPWDGAFAWLGIGTAMDHNVHHALVSYNFGHFFMWWDWLFGTYKSGAACSKMRASHMRDAAAAE